MLLNPLKGNSLTHFYSKVYYLYNECLPPPTKKRIGRKTEGKEKGVWPRFLKHNSFKINCYVLRSRINAHSLYEENLFKVVKHVAKCSKRDHVYVVVQFYPCFKFYFPGCFWVW